MAARHCDKHGKRVKHVSCSAVSVYITEEIHTFMCTNNFADQRIEVEINQSA